MDPWAIPLPVLGHPPQALGLVERKDEKTYIQLPGWDLQETRAYLADLLAEGVAAEVISVQAPAQLEEQLRADPGTVGSPHILGFIGRCCGTSTLAFETARALVGRKVTVGLLELNVDHPDLYPRLGLEGAPAVVGGLVLPRMKEGVRLSSVANFTRSADRLPFAAEALETVLARQLEDVLWARPQVLLLDLPDRPAEEIDRLLSRLSGDLVLLRSPFDRRPEPSYAWPVLGRFESPSVSSRPGVPVFAADAAKEAGTPYADFVEELSGMLCSKVPNTEG